MNWVGPYIIRLLALEDLSKDVLDPLFIRLGGSRVPAVQAVKLDTADISLSSLEHRVILLPDFLRIETVSHSPTGVRDNRETYSERVQTPTTSLPDQAQDTTEVIREHYAGEPSCVAEAGNLEDFLLLGEKNLILLGVLIGEGSGINKGTAFVNLQKFLGDVLLKFIRLVCCTRCSYGMLEDARCDYD